MSVTRDNVRGTLQIDRIPPNLCWGKPADFIQQLVRIVSIELGIPPSTDFVVTGHQTPTEDDKNRVWIRLDRNRNFLGFYMFISGAWRRVFNRPINEVIWYWGDSREIPPGFALIDGTAPAMPADVQAHVQTFYHRNSSITSITVWDYFAVLYTGIF